MRKLHKLKSWLTLFEASDYLAGLIGESVDTSELLRFALDGHLALSVRFVSPARARHGRLVPLSQAKRTTMPGLDGELFEHIEGLVLNGDMVLELGQEIVTLEGVWDLAMIGAEKIDVEHEYQQRTFGPEVDSVCLEGAFVYEKSGIYFQLLDRFARSAGSAPISPPTPFYHPSNYYPAPTVLEKSVFVVRPEALRVLAARIEEMDPTNSEQTPEMQKERPLGRRERTTLLIMVAALARLAKVDISKSSSAAAAIENQTTLMGARVASRTIENHLKLVPEALESRSDD